MMQKIGAMESQINQRLCALERSHQDRARNQPTNEAIHYGNSNTMRQDAIDQLEEGLDPITVSQSSLELLPVHTQHDSSSSISVIDHEDIEQPDTTNQDADQHVDINATNHSANGQSGVPPRNTGKICSEFFSHNVC